MRYNVEDPETGASLVLEGDTPPTEAELTEIFAAHRARTNAGALSKLGDFARSQPPPTAEDLDLNPPSAQAQAPKDLPLPTALNRPQKLALQAQAEALRDPAFYDKAENYEVGGALPGLAQKAVQGVGSLLKGAATYALTTPIAPEPGQIPDRKMTEFNRKLITESPAEKLARVQRSPIYVAGQAVSDVAPETYPIPQKAEGGLLTKAGESVGGFAVPLASAGAAPVTMALQSMGEHIDADYQKELAQGKTPNEAADAAIKRAQASGVSQAVIWSVMPGFLREVTDKWIVDKFAEPVGEKVVKRFLLGRVANTAEQGALGAASGGTEAAISGENPIAGAAEGATGLGIIGALSPRGRTLREEQEKEAFLDKPAGLDAASERTAKHSAWFRTFSPWGDEAVQENQKPEVRLANPPKPVPIQRLPSDNGYRGAPTAELPESEQLRLTQALKAAGFTDTQLNGLPLHSLRWMLAEHQRGNPNAVQERSTEAVPVGEASGSSQEVGEGSGAPEESAVSQTEAGQVPAPAKPEVAPAKPAGPPQRSQESVNEELGGILERMVDLKARAGVSQSERKFAWDNWLKNVNMNQPNALERALAQFKQKNPSAGGNDRLKRIVRDMLENRPTSQQERKDLWETVGAKVPRVAGETDDAWLRRVLDSMGEEKPNAPEPTPAAPVQPVPETKPLPETAKPKPWEQELQDAMRVVRRRISIRDDVEGAVGQVRKGILDRGFTQLKAMWQAVMDAKDPKEKIRLWREAWDERSGVIQGLDKERGAELYEMIHNASWDTDRAWIDHNVSSIPQGVRALRLQSQKRPDVHYIVTPSTYPDQQGKWQATRFDEHGPSGHFNADSLEDAVRSLSGEDVKGIGLPWGSMGEFEIESGRNPEKALTPAAKNGSVEEAAAPGTGTERTATVNPDPNSRSTDGGKAPSISAEGGESPSRGAAAGLTEEDGLLFHLANSEKVPVFMPKGIRVAQFTRLSRKGWDAMSPKERDLYRSLRETFPQNYEDDYGKGGEAMRAAYEAAKKAGIAGEIFRVVQDGRNLKLDNILGATGHQDGVALFNDIERLAKAHMERKSGRSSEAALDAEAESQVKQQQAFARDNKRATPGTEIIPQDSLVKGASFTLKGAKVRVKDVFTDEDGRITSIELEDGARYGTQVVDGGYTLRADKDSLNLPKSAAEDPWGVDPEPEPEPQVEKIPGIEALESIPVRENGGRTAIILRNGTAITGKGTHASVMIDAVSQGIATDPEIADGYAGFIRPDGVAWGVNGKPLKFSRVVAVDTSHREGKMPKQTGRVAEALAPDRHPLDSQKLKDKIGLVLSMESMKPAELAGGVDMLSGVNIYTDKNGLIVDVGNRGEVPEGLVNSTIGFNGKTWQPLYDKSRWGDGVDRQKVIDQIDSALGIKKPEPPKPKVQPRPLTKKEQDEFQDLSIKAKRAREQGGEPLNTEETQRYEYLTALAGQMDLLGEDASSGIRARIKQLKERGAEMERHRELATENWRKSPVLYSKFEEQVNQWNKAIQANLDEIDKLERQLRGEAQQDLPSQPAAAPAAPAEDDLFSAAANKPKAPEQPKKPLELMTPGEAIGQRDAHRYAISEAIRAGRPVSADALIVHDDLRESAELHGYKQVGNRWEKQAESTPLPAEQAAAVEEAKAAAKAPEGGAKAGTQVNGFVKWTDGRWYRLDENGNLPMKENGKPNRIPSNKKQHAQLEEEAAKPPKPPETRTPAEILERAKYVKVTVPQGAYFLRATDERGRKAVIPIHGEGGINKGENSFHGVKWTKLEAGTKRSGDKFIVVPGDVKVEEVSDSRKASLAAEGEEAPSNPQPPVASGLSTQQLRSMLDDPKVDLEPRTKQLLGKFLDSGIADKLPGLKWEISRYLEGGATGEYADSVAKFLHFADADVPIHEFFHHLERFLQPEDRKFIHDLRLEMVRREAPQMGAEFERGISSDQFLERGYNRDLYHLANDSEFFTWMMTNRAMDQLQAPEAKTFAQKVRGMIQKLWDAFKDAFGFSKYEDVLFRQISSGKYDYKFDDARKWDQGRQAALARSPEEYRKFRALGEQAVPVRTVGAYGDLARMKLEEADRLNLSDRARRLLNLPRSMEMFSMAASETHDIYGYADARERVKNASPHIRWNVTKDALQSMGYDQRRSMKVQKDFETQKALIESPEFRTKLSRLAQADIRARLTQDREDTYRNIISQKVGEFMVQIQNSKVADARLERLQQDMRIARQLRDFATAVGIQMDQVVSRVWRNYWETGADNRTAQAFTELYLAIRRREGNPVTNPQELALVRMASEVLAVNRSMAEQMMWMQRLREEPDFAQAVNDFGRAFARRIEQNPVEAIKQLVAKEGKLATKAADAERAFVSLNRQVMKELERYSDLEGAYMVDQRLKQSPQWQQLVDTVYSDAQAVRIPDNILEQVKGGEVFNEFTGRVARIDPEGNLHEIELGWTKQSAQAAQRGLQRYLDTVDEWLHNPANENSPDRNYWQRERDFVDSVYNTLSVLDPSAVKSLGFHNPWSMPEFFFRQASIPALKVLQKAFENWHRAFVIGQQWSGSTEQPLIRQLYKAAQAHNREFARVKGKGGLFGWFNTDKQFDPKLGFQEYRERVLNPLAWEYRHGHAVQAGDMLMGVKILQEDIDALKMMGGRIGQLLNQAKNLGAERVMQEGLLFDEWAKGVFAIRKPQEFGAEPGTTVPREIAQRARTLAIRVAEHIRPDDYERLADLFNSQPYFEPFVMRWLGQRSSDYSKITPFEDIFADIVRKYNEGDPETPRTVQEIIDFIDQNTDDTYDANAITKIVVGGMADELRGFHERFVKEKKDSPIDVRSLRASQDGPFTKGFERDVGNSFYYDYGMVNAQEVRSAAIDASMYHLTRFARSLKEMEGHLERAMLDLTDVKNNPEARQRLLQRNKQALRSGDDFRDLSVIQDQLAFVKKLGENLAIFSGSKVATFESLNNLYRMIGDEVTAKLGGLSTLVRVFTGSAFKQAFVMRALERSYLTSFPKAYASMMMSLMKIGIGGPATLLGRRLGILKRFEGDYSGWAEEIYRTGRFFDQQYQYGLGTKTPTLDAILNNLRMPYTHGRGYDPHLSNFWLTRGAQKAFYRMLSVAEAPLEVIHATFPALGYAVAYDSVARQMHWAIKGLEAQARKSFDFHEKRGTLSRFDLQNPKSLQNVLTSEEILPRGLFPRHANALNQVREMFNRGTDQDLQDAIMKFWAKLAATPADQRKDVHLLSAEARTPEEAKRMEETRAGALASIGLFDIHHASPANRPWELKASPLGRLAFPIMGWFAQSTRQIPALLGRAPYDRAMGKALLTAMTGVGVAAFLGTSLVAGDLEKRLWEKLMWITLKKVDPVRHIGQGRNAKEEAQIAVSDVTGYITILNSMFNMLLGEESNRGQFGAQVFVTEAVNSWLNYFSGVIHTKDPTYGLAAFASRELPISKILVNRMESQEGIVNERNLRTLIQRYAPQELVRQTTGGFGLATPTELSPIKQQLANAIYRNDSIGVQQAYGDFVRKATELGRPDPERLAQEVLRSLNPYSLSLVGHPTDAQRTQILAHLTPEERQMLLDGENQYMAAAQSLGVGSQMVKEERAPKGAGGSTGGGGGLASVGGGGGAISMPSGGVTGLPAGRIAASLGSSAGLGRVPHRISLTGGGSFIPRLSGPGATSRRLSLRSPAGGAASKPRRLVSGRLKPRSGRISTGGKGKTRRLSVSTHKSHHKKA